MLLATATPQPAGAFQPWRPCRERWAERNPVPGNDISVQAADRDDATDCPPGPDQLQGVGRSPGRRHTWWVSPFGGISARRVAGWRVRIDLVGALEFSVHLAAGGSRFGATCLRLVL